MATSIVIVSSLITTRSWNDKLDKEEIPYHPQLCNFPLHAFFKSRDIEVLNAWLLPWCFWHPRICRESNLHCDRLQEMSPCSSSSSQRPWAPAMTAQQKKAKWTYNVYININTCAHRDGGFAVGKQWGGAGVGWANNNVQVGVAHRCDATLRDVHLHLCMYVVLRSRCLTSRTGWGWDGVGAQNGTSWLRKLSLVAKRLRNKTARSCQLSCQLSSCTRFLMSSRRWTHYPVRVCIYIYIHTS